MTSSALADIPIIDSDSHVSEPADLWTSRLPSKWRDDAPAPVWHEATGEYHWRVGGSLLQGITAFSQAGWSEYPPQHPKKVEDTDPACYDAKARLERLDEYGIYAQVLYPNVLGFSAASFIALEDSELALACVRAYNDFLTEWAEADPNRLLPVTMLPFWDLDAAIAEVHRAADNGHRGVLLAANYEKVQLPNIWEPHWEPLLKALEERGQTCNFHVGFNELTPEMVTALSTMPGEQFARAAVPTIMNNVKVIVDLICTGLCHNFPGLNFVSVESGGSYLPYVMESLDWQWKNHGVHTRHPDWELPSFYLRRQIFGSYWFERESIARVIDLIPDNVMFETDFPHPISLSPGPASFAENPRKMAEASMEGVSEDIVRKVFFETAAKLYRVEVPG
jgi:predicted TIM-barrel fold metal-dependent hydrolase